MIVKFFIVFILSLTFLNAQNFYTLSDVDKAYLLVEVSKKIPSESKQIIYDELKNTTDELGIDTSGYSGRVIAFLVGEKYLESQILINVKLIVGEQVRREGSSKSVYADTYVDTMSFLYKDDEHLEEMLEESVYTLLDNFSQQYKSENKVLKTIDINKDNVADVLKYETDYKKALEISKKEKKDIMLVLVSNYCPWCRKFEKEILAQVELNKTIHEKFVPLIINKETKAFPKEFNTTFTPVVYFIDYKNGKSYKNIVGYNSKDEFIYSVKN